MDKRIDFIILGSMKCGTTFLSAILANHPSINFSKKKEPHFFAKTPNWKKNLDTYHKLFDFQPGKLNGEASTSFTKDATQSIELAKALKAYNPNLKFIYLIRNPLERYISHYVHSRERGFSHVELKDSLSQESSIMETGCYFKQLQPYLDQFNKEVFFIDSLEHLKNSPNQFLQRLYDFLEIDFISPTEASKSFQNSGTTAFRLNHKHDQLVQILIRIGKWAPKGLKSLVKKIILKFAGSKIEHRPVLSDSLQSQLTNIYQKDLAQLSNFFDNDFNKILN